MEKARRVDRDIIAQQYLGMKVTANERKHILSPLGSHFSVDLYTGSNADALPVHNRERVKTLTEMPQVFAHSKINLNIIASTSLYIIIKCQKASVDSVGHCFRGDGRTADGIDLTVRSGSSFSMPSSRFRE